MERHYELEGIFDLRSTVSMVKAGRVDRSGLWWWSTRTADGAATVRVEHSSDGLTARAWGDGCEAMLDRVPSVLGLDDYMTIEPRDPQIADLLRRTAGTRLGASGSVFEATVIAVLGQVVTTIEARRSTKRLIDRFGVPAPGPDEARLLFPSPERIAGLTYHDIHDLGVERRRAATVVEVARRANRLQEIMDMPPDRARERLRAVRGVGPWTAEFVMGTAYGDKDAVTPGDYHLPNMIAHALAGEPRGDDGRMFELLEPYRPERRRIVVALKIEGVQAPRYGPKTAIRDHF